MGDLREFSADVVAQHCTVGDLWLTIEGNVYDLTTWARDHPGGSDVLVEVAGTDATAAFKDQGHSAAALEDAQRYRIGVVRAAAAVDAPKAEAGVTTGAPGVATVDRVAQWMSTPYAVTAYAAVVVAFVMLVMGGFTVSQLGMNGRFRVVGYPPSPSGGYAWRLAERTWPSGVTAWGLFAAHQASQWLLVREAQLVRPAYGWRLPPVAVKMAWVNLAFILLRLLQSWLFYDGLAGYTNENASQTSVLFVLAITLPLFAPERGYAFGWQPQALRDAEWVRAFRTMLVQTHGYVISFGCVFTFWYHPAEAFWAHLSGFMFMVFLLGQSSMMFTEWHRDRRWVLLLELLIWPHAALTALEQMATRGAADYLFLFLLFFHGFFTMFLVTQVYLLPALGRAARAVLWGVYAVTLAVSFAGRYDMLWVVMLIPTSIVVPVAALHAEYFATMKVLGRLYPPVGVEGAEGGKVEAPLAVRVMCLVAWYVVDLVVIASAFRGFHICFGPDCRTMGDIVSSFL